MGHSKRVVVAAVVVPLALAACQTNEQTGGLLGTLGGGALGAGLGGAISHNATGAVIGGLIGAAGGYFVGSAIGRELDRRDQQIAAMATTQALEKPASAPPQKWHSDHTDASGSAKVVAVHHEANGGECKTVQEIAYIKGQEVRQDSRYCQTPDGSWAAT